MTNEDTGLRLEQYVREYQYDSDFIAEAMAINVIEEALHLMYQQQMSQSALAQVIGVSRAHVSRILNAPPNLTLRSIARLAVALGAEPHVSLTTPRHVKERKPEAPIGEFSFGVGTAGESRPSVYILPPEGAYSARRQEEGTKVLVEAG